MTVKNLKTYGNGSERLEELMNEWLHRRPSNWEAYDKYLTLFDECQQRGKKTPEQTLKKVYNAFARTFEKIADEEQRLIFREKFEQTWPMMRDHIRKNPAIAQYYLEQVVDSPSFYDAMRRILDPGASGASVLEAAFGVTWDIAGNYGPLELDDPSTLFDVYTSIMNEPRWRSYPVESKLRELAGRGEKARVFAGGFGLGPECRHFGISLKDLRALEIVAVDREIRMNELDEVFQYAHKVDFAQTGIKLYQDDIINFVNTHPELHGQMEYGYTMGVLSYCKSRQEKCDLMDAVLTLLRPGATYDFDLQTVDSCLRLVSKIFGWSEEYPLRPEKSADAAIDEVIEVCKMCGADLNYYEVDPRNDPPVGVRFSVSRG